VALGDMALAQDDGEYDDKYYPAHTHEITTCICTSYVNKYSKTGEGSNEYLRIKYPDCLLVYT